MSELTISGATVLWGPELTPTEKDIAIRGNKIVPPGSERGEGRTIAAEGLTLLPGFIDAHVHIGFFEPRLLLLGGVTVARDLAWPSDRIFPLVEASAGDPFDGPRILAAGPMLTVDGGYPTRAAWAPRGTGLVVGSPAEADSVVADVAAKGACIVKVALNAEVGPTLDPARLSAITRAAHERGLRVTAHVYGLAELQKAIACGVDELAHMLMSPEEIPDETLGRMVAADMTVVPTLSIMRGKQRAIAEDNLRRFVEKGGTVVYGTDLGNEGPSPGIEADEIAGMVAAGMSGHQIIAAATTVSARRLGLVGGNYLADGQRANIIGVAGDPLSDPLAVSKIELVVKDGRVVTEP